MPVVLVGRGNAEGFVPPPAAPFIGGRNLTATKARLLLLACLMKLGSVPAAADPDRPTASETDAVQKKIREYQDLFDTHERSRRGSHAGPSWIAASTSRRRGGSRPRDRWFRPRDDRRAGSDGGQPGPPNSSPRC